MRCDFKPCRMCQILRSCADGFIATAGCCLANTRPKLTAIAIMHALPVRAFFALEHANRAILLTHFQKGVCAFVSTSIRPPPAWHPIVIEQKYLPGDTDYSQQLNVIRESRAEAIVLWIDEAQAALLSLA